MGRWNYFLFLTLSIWILFTKVEGHKLPLGVILTSEDDVFFLGFKLGTKSWGDLFTMFDILEEKLPEINEVTINQASCRLRRRGALIFIASPNIVDLLAPFAEAYKIPIISTQPTKNGIAMNPPMSGAITDLIRHNHWRNLVVLSDKNADVNFGLHFASEMISGIYQLNSTSNVILRSIQKSNSPQTVLLDTDLDFAKEIFSRLVHDPFIVKSAFHFVLMAPTSDEFWGSLAEEYGPINVTGFRITDEESVKDLKRVWSNLHPDYWPGAGTDTIPMDAILGYDCGLIVLRAYRDKLFPKLRAMQYSGFNLTAVQCMNVVPQEGGLNLGPTLREVFLTNTLTGQIAFDSRTGLRKNFRLDVLEKTPSGLRKLGIWSESKGLEMSPTPQVQFPHKTSSQKTAILYLKSPYLMTDTNQTNRKGFGVDLLDILSSRLNISFQTKILKEYPTSKYNLTAGKWDGPIGDLISGKVDLLMIPLIYDEELAKLISFSPPIQTSTITILLKKLETASTLDLLLPFSWLVWICFLAAMVVFGGLLYLVARFTKPLPKTRTNLWGDTIIIQVKELTVVQCFWLIWTSLMLKENFIFPRSIASRITMIVWWLFLFFFLSLYFSNLTSELALSKFGGDFRKFKLELQSRSSLELLTEALERKYLQLGIVEGSDIFRYFEKTTDPLFESYFQWTNSGYDLLVPDLQKGIERVRSSSGKFALIAPSHEAAFRNDECDLMVVKGSLFEQSFHLASSVGSSFSADINRAIIELTQSGQLKKLEDKWWPATCTARSKEKHHSPIAIVEVSILFYIFVTGIVTVVIAVLLEFFNDTSLKSWRFKFGRQKKKLNKEFANEIIIDTTMKDESKRSPPNIPIEVFPSPPTPPPPTDEELRELS